MTAYDTLVDLATTHADGVSEVIHGATVNDLAKATNAIRAELGAAPRGAAASVSARLATLLPFSDLTPTLHHDGVTDDAVSINAALAALGPGTAELGKYAFGYAHPIIIPNGVKLRGQGGQQGATTLTALSSFPKTTISGAQTTPASSATTFTLTVASTAGFPLGSGGITPPGGQGVLCVAGIRIYYTGTTPTTFTGCRTYFNSVTLANGRKLSTPHVWLDDPGDTSGFGTRLEGVLLDGAHRDASCLLHTCHAQEGAGWHDVNFGAFTLHAFVAESNPYSAGSAQAVNYDWDKGWVRISNTSAEAEAIGIDIIHQQVATGNTKLDAERGGRDVTFTRMGSSGASGVCAMRLNGATGTYHDLHFEANVAGIIVGDVYPCSVTIENVWQGGAWGSGPVVKHCNTPGNRGTYRRIGKSSAAQVPGLVVLRDDINSMSITDEEVTEYTVFQDGAARYVYSTSLAPMPEPPNISLLATEIAAGARDNASGSSLTVTFTAVSTVGDLLIIAVGASGDGVPTSITDSRGNTWQIDKTQAGQGWASAIASCRVTVAHQVGDTLTIPLSVTHSWAVGTVSRWAGGKTSSWLDLTAGNSASAGLGSSTVFGPRTQALELIFGVEAYNDAATQTPGNSYTLLQNKAVGGSSNRKLCIVYKTVASVGSDAVTFTTDVANYDIAAASYKAAGLQAGQTVRATGTGSGLAWSKLAISDLNFSAPTVTGSRGGNAALASLLTQLAALGIVVDGSS